MFLFPPKKDSPAFVGKTSPLLLLAFFLILLSPSYSVGKGIPIQFLSDSLQVEAGQSQVIAFRRVGKLPAPAEYPVSIHPADAVEVLQPAKILTNQPVGYLRIRPLKPGKATLTVAGQSLALEISPRTTPRLVVAPRITSPLQGASAWGEIAVAAECFLPGNTLPHAILRLPNGESLTPEPSSTESSGPGWQFLFLLDTSRLPAGDQDLTLEVYFENKLLATSDLLTIRVAFPSPEEILADECENRVNTPRPESYGEKFPSIRNDESASGGQMVNNYSSDPVWLTEVVLKQAGHYQMMIVARGDEALGAFPTLMLRVNDQPRAVTNGRVTDRQWRRTPLGLPMRFEAGKHLLGVRFENDFSEGKVDRNLYLDRYELAKVDAPGAQPAPEPDEPMLATMTMMETRPAAGKGSRFRIYFDSIFDGKTIGGPVTLTAQCRLDDPSSKGFPEVELWLNARSVAKSIGPGMIFTLDPAQFQPGKNILQLRAKNSEDKWVESGAQTLTFETASRAKAAQTHYFTMYDRGWDGTMTGRYEVGDGKRPTDSAAWISDGESILQLPDSLSGAFDLSVLARGQNFQGPPKLEIALRQEGKETPVAVTNIEGDWTETYVGALEARSGAKELIVRFVNDKYDGENGDRNLWLRWIKLAEKTNDIIPEKTTILTKYWPGQQPVGLADAIVVDLVAPRAVRSVDLSINDNPQNLEIDVSDGLNPVLIPLLTRSLGAGSHRVKIVVHHIDGGKTESSAREIRVSADREPSRGLYSQSVKMLDRLGLGASQKDLVKILVAGPEKWLAESLGPENVGQREMIANALDAQFYGQNASERLVQKALYEAVIDPNPVRQRFVLWTQNHFSTWMEKAGREKKRREHEAFARLGVAPFFHLLLTSATSPAMLTYLDQQRSFAGRLNENYARELLELHTVGVGGGYAQADVTALANLLTGWSMAEQGDLAGTGDDLVGEFRYDPRLNAGDALQVMGLDFPVTQPLERFDRVLTLLEALAAHPSTGEHLARKLAESYVSNPAPEALVRSLGRVYAKTGGDMQSLLLSLAQSGEFARSPRRVATPLDFALRVSRAASITDTSLLADFLRRSGMGLFDHSTPDGYPAEDANYVSSNAMMQRWRFAQRVESRLITLIPRSWRDARDLSQEQTQRMLDLAAVRLLGRCLSPKSNRAAMDLLAKAPPHGQARARLIVQFICQTPEAGLR